MILWQHGLTINRTYDSFDLPSARNELVMAKPLVSDALWVRIEPLIPRHHSPAEQGGRPPIEDRAALTGILFVLKTGIPCEICRTRYNAGAELPVGAGYAIGIRRVCGRSCTRCCSQNCARPTQSTGSEAARAILRWLGIRPHLAKHFAPHGSGRGKIRYVVERTISWFR